MKRAYAVNDSDKTPHTRSYPGLNSQEPMASDKAQPCELDQEKYDADDNVKIICLGDSAVGKSKLMERFLMDGFRPQQLSTYALTLYKHTATVDGKTVLVDFWDTAGQERFQSMHASYYHKAHACIMVFDVQRKVTYKNLSTWYTELREFRPEIPCIVVANKIDDIKVTQKSFNFARKFSLPLYFVSAADGTNVVKLFNDAIRLAVSYKHNSRDFMDEVLQELEVGQVEMLDGTKKTASLQRDAEHKPVEWLLLAVVGNTHSSCMRPLELSELPGQAQGRPHLQPCPQNFDLEQKEEEVPDQVQRGNIESPSPS
ncbi:rab-like protein 2B isoform X2 [Ursus maritimus]|uniref:Rab-like protein 2B isoform X2 n=2 Tax=Ursidae TaxID=9632 RepID=A0A384D237_URSMA|nr:rab-like protein 2B isoform X2 [Ursus maritimus]